MRGEIELLVTALLAIGLPILTFTVNFGGILSIGVPFLLLATVISLLTSEAPAPPLRFIVAPLLFVISVQFSLLFVDGSILYMCVPRAGMHVVGLGLYWVLLGGKIDPRKPGGVPIATWRGLLVISGLVTSLHYLSNLFFLGSQGVLDEAVQDRSGALMSLSWGSSNMIAGVLMISFFASLIEARRWRPALLATSVIFAGILGTMSRGALGSLVAGAGLYSVLHRSVAVPFALLVVGATLGGLTIYMVDAQILDRLFDARVSTSGSMQNFNGRTEIWEHHINEIIERFPYPVGYYGSLDNFGYSSHNIILILLIEIGFWGLAAYITMQFIAITSLIETRTLHVKLGRDSANTDILLCGLLSILLNLMFEDHGTQVYIINFWIFMGLVVRESLPD